MKSTKFSLNVRDVVKGFIMAIGTPAVYYLLSMIPGNFPPELKILLSAFATYLVKNFFTDDVKAAEKILDQATADEIAARKTSL